MSNTKFALPDTGQVSCYSKDGKEIDLSMCMEDLYGQDGYFTKNPQSFKKLTRNGVEISNTSTWEDGYRMVLDENTGLMWEAKSRNSIDINYAGDLYTWQDAHDIYINNLNEKQYGGFNDWRIPNKDELRSIINYGVTNPAIDMWYFPNSKVANYWTINTYEMEPFCAWVIFLGLGSGIVTSKVNKEHVIAVRGGYDQLFGKKDAKKFKDNGDGTVTDIVTGLMWQQGENPRMNWYDALKSCPQMTLAGYNDWRMPNIKELNTILNLDYDDGWWYYKEFFQAEGLKPPLLHYFSSTTFEKTYAWVTNFCFGYDGYYANKEANLLFRAVRNISGNKEITEIKFRLPSTGQVTFYGDEGCNIDKPMPDERFYGQDATYAKPSIYSNEISSSNRCISLEKPLDREFKVIKDNNTGLSWEIKSFNNKDMNFYGERYSWQGALEYVDRLNNNNYGGFSDWRLPNKEELRTIVNYNNRIPAIDNRIFYDCLPEFYWCKDEYMSDPKMAWGIYFAYGCSICYPKTTPYYVRAVRGGYNKNFGDKSAYMLIDNGDGTVSDLNTSLMWKQDESPEMNFEEALKYCSELELGGYQGWRLPNIKELATLLDLSYSDSTWFDKNLFPNVKTLPQGFYMSSTTFSSVFGWGVNFQFGYDGYYANKRNGHYPFRPVRKI